MKSRQNGSGVASNGKTTYLVEFPCYSTFIVEFEDAPGLTERQIIANAQKLAEVPFANEGGMTTEFGKNGCTYAFVAVGIEPQRAQITGKPLPDRPKLRLVK